MISSLLLFVEITIVFLRFELILYHSFTKFILENIYIFKLRILIFFLTYKFCLIWAYDSCVVTTNILRLWLRFSLNADFSGIHYTLEIDQQFCYPWFLVLIRLSLSLSIHSYSVYKHWGWHCPESFCEVRHPNLDNLFLFIRTTKGSSTLMFIWICALFLIDVIWKSCSQKTVTFPQLYSYVPIW